MSIASGSPSQKEQFFYVLTSLDGQNFEEYGLNAMSEELAVE